MAKNINRRNFIKSSALVGASTAMFPSKTIGSTNDNKKLRLGVIGTGLRGQGMIYLSLLRKDVDIKAICDVDSDMINSALRIIKKGQGLPLELSMPSLW